MAQTVGDFVVQRLLDWGVKRVFAFPGDGINGLTGAFNQRQNDIEWIQVRHEELAAFMACAHAKFTGEVGVCVATSGPGAIHLLNGLYDAKMDHQPVVAIVGQSARTAMGGNYQQEVDLQSLYKDVACEYVQTGMAPSQVRALIDRAIRIAKDQRTVTCVILPNDLQELPYEEPAREHNTLHTGVGYCRPYIVPRREDLERAAEVLNAGQRVSILIGAGALGAGKEVETIANLLQAGVAKALLGKAALPDTLPFVTGAIGLLGTRPSWNMMTNCDTLLMIGSSFPYSEFLPKEGQARGVQIDIDGRMVSLRYPMEVPLIGDAGETLRQLIPLLQQKPRTDWRDSIEKDIAEWWRILEARAHLPANPINPERVFWELSPLLPDNAVICVDCGTTTDWYARDVKLREGMLASLSGNLATMGNGMPYAVAAKLAYPDRPVFGLIGDGAMEMNGMNELITAARHWQDWPDPRLIISVLKNHDLNQVTWEQRIMAGDTRFATSQEVPDFSFSRYAELLGLRGIAVERPEDIVDAWQQAIASDRPCVIEFTTDREVPPLPPHITFNEAKGFLTSVAKRDTGAPAYLRMSFLEMAQDYLPHPEKK